jgi:type IV secretory pathway VirB10-like protein
MSKHDLQNERLDQIGRNLFKATRVNNEEIEKIVAAPQLFDSVKARIAVEEQLLRKPNLFFGNWASLFFWNRQSVASAFAILIVLLTCAAVLIIKKQGSSQLVEQMIKPETRPQIKRAENQPLPSEIKETKIKETKNPAIKNRVDTERIVFKVETPKLQNSTRKPSPQKTSQSAKKQPQEVFYSLASAGNWEANGEDLQIVRTELSRSELFALGVDVPVENDTAKIKTNLLVGADGVARAIRFVE